MRRLGPNVGRNIVIVVALVSAGFFGAWLRFKPYLEHEARYTDGRHVFELSEIKQLRFAVWDESTPLPPVINTTGAEGRAAISPDGNVLVFQVGEPGLNAELWVANIIDDKPVFPRPLSRVNSAGDELAPAFDQDGLLFASNRAGGEGGLDIWRAAYVDGVFGVPMALPPGLNSEHDETDPGPVPGSGAIAFASDRPRGMRKDYDLYWAVPAYEGESDWTIKSFDSINSAFDEREPTFTSDGRSMAFASDRDGGLGGFDLYQCAQNNGSWEAPALLRGLNTEQDERAPHLSPDGFTLLFTVASEFDAGNLHRARSLELFRLPGRGVGWLDLTLLAVLLLLALLAWLGRRWEAMDILYKCLLLSLLLHLLLIWWFREVPVEHEPSPANGKDETFKVKISPTSAVMASARERAGNLDVAPALAVAEIAPTRSQVEATRPESTPSAAQTALARDAVSDRSGPQVEAAASNVTPAPAEVASAIDVAQPAPDIQTHTGEAPALAIAPASNDAPPVQMPDAHPGQRAASPSVLESKPDAPATEGLQTEQVAVLSESPLPATDSTLVPTHESTDHAMEVTEPNTLEPELAVAPAPPVVDLASWIVDGPVRTGVQSEDVAPSRQQLATGPSTGTPSAAPSSLESQPVNDYEGPAASAQVASIAKTLRARGVAVAQPDTSVQRRSGAAPEMSLQASTLGGSPSLSPQADPVARAVPSLTDSGLPTSEPSKADALAFAVGDAVSDGRLPPREVFDATRDRAITEHALALASPAAVARPPAPDPTAPAIDLDAWDSTGLAEPPDRGDQGRPDRVAAFEALTEVAGPSQSQPLTARPTDTFPDVSTGTLADASNAGPLSRDLPDVTVRDADTAPTSEDGSNLLVEDNTGLTLAATTTARPEERGGFARPPWRGGGAEENAAPDRPAFEPEPEVRPLVAAAPAAQPDLPKREPDEWEQTPYRTRFGEAKLRALEEHGGNLETEAAVQAGLSYLASHQSADGFWGDPEDFHEKYGRVTIGKTALCLLAFLGAGHTPQSDTQYSDATRRAVSLLLETQDPETGHFGYTAAYCHGVTTYALGECYALTGDEQLRKPLEDAVAWILKNQSQVGDRRYKGGWSYYYPDGRTFDQWPRTSITTWQVMALESARLGGIDVPDQAFDDARTFLHNAHNAENGAFLYNHDPSRLNSPYWTLPGSTPAAMFALSLLGDDLTHEAYKDTVNWVLTKAPAGYREASPDQFVHNAKGNLYFWYYGSLALFRHGGTPWESWNNRLQDTLLPAQEGDGSWVPISPYADYARDNHSDRSYTTAMCVLTLEVYYRYFTPLLHVR